MYHDASGDSSPAPTISLDAQRVILRQLRSAILQRYRPHIQEGAGPIRVMARVVSELEHECRKHGIDEDIIRSEIVNRTIGDINLRLVTECEGEPGGPGDYRHLADEMGVALPQEQLCGYTATGEAYLWLRAQMMECERLLLAHHYDLRMYDIYGTGNPLLRSWLACEMQQWGIDVQVEQVYLSLGAMDSIDKVLRGLIHMYHEQGIYDAAVLFPQPGFLVPEWQARSYGYRIHKYPTLPEYRFKLIGEQLDQILQANPDIRLLYLMVTNNPTTFAYTPDELCAIHAILKKYCSNGRLIYILADLAYIGTGKPEEDRARMATFAPPEILRQTIFVSSFSKTHSLTGERFGWVTCGDPRLASKIAVCWANSVASLPGEWQLRFMAYYRLFQDRPWLVEKMRAFYHFRRTRLIEQLHRINEKFHLFAEIYLDDDATVYNWSKLRSGEDAFSVFEKIGIAGVPGSGFGYSDDYIRFSVGVIPIP